MKSLLMKALLLGGFLFLFAPTAEAIDCCCNLSGSCSGQICRICDNCSGCSITCNGCESESHCTGCIDFASGNLENVRVSEAVAFLTERTNLQVGILGNVDARVSLSYSNRSVRDILKQIELETGVHLEVFERGAQSRCAGGGDQQIAVKTVARAVQTAQVGRDSSAYLLTLEGMHGRRQGDAI